MRFFFVCLLLGVWPLSEASAQRVRELPSQEEIAATFRDTDGTAKAHGDARGYARAIPHEQWTPELRSAILYSLENEIRLDKEAIQAGVQRWYDEPASVFLSELAVVMQDPAAIPLLVQVPMGFLEESALANFGRQAFPEVLRVARAPNDADYYAVRSCLITLRVMVQQWGLEYFTPQERAQLKAVVALYVSPTTPPIRADWSYVRINATVNYAAQLGLVLEGVEIREWVERLVTSREAFEESTGGRLDAYTEKMLKQDLDGGPMLPVVKPLSVYLRGLGWVSGYK